MGSRSWSRQNRKNLISCLEDRFCPPIEVLLEGGEDVERHLRICPHCNQRLEEASEWSLTASSHDWEKLVNDPEKVIDRIIPGEIRRLHAFGHHWDERKRGLYYNEPLVVVLTSDEEYTKVSLLNTNGAFLFGDEEIKLQCSSISGWAESWNTFGVQTRLIGSRVIDATSQQQAQEILERSRGDFRSWERGSSIWHFHMSEIKVGWYYSRFNFIDRGISEADIGGGGILEGKLALKGQLAIED